MPIVADIYNSFLKKYGAKAGKGRYFAWENANPAQAAKALRTAVSRGDKIIGSTAKNKTKKIAARGRKGR